jgi:glyoxylase-like metal-dependent hydrolase (beta-lactamase superfamily II)
MSDRNLMIGDVEILRVVDAIVDYPFPLDEFYPGVPIEAWDPWRDQYPATFATEKTHRLVYTCYVLRSAGQTILVDTGLGPAWAPLAVFWQQHLAIQQAFGLLDELQAVGVRPEDVEKVFLTHLHPDHVGWNLLQENGQYQLTFPRAHYVVHQADWEAFHTPEMQAILPFDYIGVHVTPLEHLGALELLTTDGGLAPGIAVIHTPGHTPGHMSVAISSKGQNAILVGDAFFHPAQITEPTWNSMFDVDKEMAHQTRRRLLERITADDAIVYASHFAAPGIGRIVRRDQRYYWQAREE